MGGFSGRGVQPTHPTQRRVTQMPFYLSVRPTFSPPLLHKGLLLKLLIQDVTPELTTLHEYPKHFSKRILSKMKRRVLCPEHHYLLPGRWKIESVLGFGGLGCCGKEKSVPAVHTHVLGEGTYTFSLVFLPLGK